MKSRSLKLMNKTSNLLFYTPQVPAKPSLQHVGPISCWRNHQISYKPRGRRPGVKIRPEFLLSGLKLSHQFKFPLKMSEQQWPFLHRVERPTPPPNKKNVLLLLLHPKGACFSRSAWGPVSLAELSGYQRSVNKLLHYKRAHT